MSGGSYLCQLGIAQVLGKVVLPYLRLKKPEKLITLAELKRDIQAGNLLQVEDYSLTEIKVTEDNPLINNDLTDVLALSKFKTLQGHLISENLKSGSLLSPSVVISPNDSRF